jgi:outer membrane protein assembly factor BamE
MNFRALALSLILPVFLTGCGNFTLFPGVHKIVIQQGNMVDEEMVGQLRPGMTKAQVRFVLGTPLVTDTFNDDRWDYYFMMTDQRDMNQNERFTVYFVNDVLDSYEGTIEAPAEESESETTATSEES